MLKVEMDGVVKEYAMKAMYSVFWGLNAIYEMRHEPSDQTMEEIFMATLGAMITSGSATHRYRSKDKVDEFLATDRLVRHWSWVFPGDRLKANRNEREIFEISAKRSRFFNGKWPPVDKDNPPPTWPD